MKRKKPAKRASGDIREAILDAAEAQLREAGPGAIRLQDVAGEVGVSHPAVLHHFGSREGLVRAVVERAIRTLQADLFEALSRMPAGSEQGSALFERVFDVLFEKGHARLMAWLLLSGHEEIMNDEVRTGWTRIAELTHASRLASYEGKTPPSYEDTRFTVVLSALVLFGEAIAGRATFDMAGFGTRPRVGPKFRKWLAAVLAAHMRTGDLPTD
jgi:AcrR family transcriptional regulator